MSGGLLRPLLGAPVRPKLLVLVVLEQFRPDYLESVRSQMAAGGFRRLLEKGAVYYDCRNRASTFSSSSIATLSTGAWPSQHGIVADHWYDRAIRRAISGTEEELLATTVVSQVAAENRTRVYVVSMDETPGALLAGTPDARLFWMDAQGRFATRGDPPDWLANANGDKAAEAARNAKWVALGARPDAPALRTVTWPEDFLALYKASPFGQQAQFDFAGEVITREKLGQSNSFDLLCIVAGSTAALGYETGGRSLLMQQLVLHLDRRIEILLGQLQKAVGENGFSLVLAGAHGAPPEPPADSRDRLAVGGERIAQAVDRTLLSVATGRVEKYLYPFLYLDTSGFRDPEPIRMAAARVALQQSPVAGYYTAGGACSTRDEWESRFRNSFHPIRSGDVMLSYLPEFVEDFSQGRGVSYGSLYNYDVKVPLCLYGPQFRAGIIDRPVELVDIAPTLARVIGVAAPSSSMGRVLAEALVE
jgi:hypothetical protein